MQLRILFLLAYLPCIASAAEITMQPSEWLPAQVKEGIIKELYATFENSSLQFEDEQRRLESATRLVNRFDQFASDAGVDGGCLHGTAI